VVSCEFGFWIISDSLESSYNDVPVRWSHVTSGHPRRLWIASGVLISPDAMSTSAVMCDDGRACKQDTSATTWPTYILHASRRMIITAATISTMIDYSQKTKTPLKSRNYSLARLPYLLVWCSNIWCFPMINRCRYSTLAAKFYMQYLLLLLRCRPKQSILVCWILLLSCR